MTGRWVVIAKAIGLGARLITGARVRRLETNSKGLVSGALWVDRDGREHFQAAKVVVMAANAIGTTRLLLLSASPTHPDGLANSSGLVAAARTGGVSAPRRWHAVAASIVAGVLVAATLWMSWPEPTLADEVMDHARHEPQAWTATQALPEAAVAEVLEGSGARLGAGAGPVTYAKRCFFGGHRVPHLVVQTGAGPVTVFVLGHREVTAATRLDEQGLAAVVLPAPRGSIAVVGRGLRDPDAVAEEVFRSVEWGA